MLIITVRWFVYRLSECSSYNFPVIIFNNLHDLQRGSGRSFTLRQEDCSILKVRCYLLFELIHSTAKNLKSHRRKKKWKPNCSFLKYCPRAFIWMDTSLRIFCPQSPKLEDNCMFSLSRLPVIKTANVLLALWKCTC